MEEVNTPTEELRIRIPQSDSGEEEDKIIRNEKKIRKKFFNKIIIDILSIIKIICNYLFNK
jgi:hypothetical protein